MHSLRSLTLAAAPLAGPLPALHARNAGATPRDSGAGSIPGTPA